MRGKKSKVGVGAILGEANASGERGPASSVTCLADMLQPFKRQESAEPVDETDRQFERIVDNIAKQIASTLPVAVCFPATTNDGTIEEGFSLRLEPSKKVNLSLPSGFALAVRPASIPSAFSASVNTDSKEWALFESVSMLSLTSFFVFTVTTDQPKKLSAEFVLNLPLVGEPEGRRESLLKHLLSDKDR
ncbi:unnamed protein product, partial [Ectocarpus fasciculatus]